MLGQPRARPAIISREPVPLGETGGECDSLCGFRVDARDGANLAKQNGGRLRVCVGSGVAFLHFPSFWALHSLGRSSKW